MTLNLKLHESHSSGPYSPPKQCICSILTTIAVTKHEYGQLCMQSELDQNDYAVLRLLPHHPLLCSQLPIDATQSNIRAPQRPHSLQHATHATCDPMLTPIAILQHYIKCHNIQLVQHWPTSRMTVHSCSRLCTQQAQQHSGGWGVSTKVTD